MEPAEAGTYVRPNVRRVALQCQAPAHLWLLLLQLLSGPVLNIRTLLFWALLFIDALLYF